MTFARLPALGAAMVVGILMADRLRPPRATCLLAGSTAVLAFVLALRTSRTDAEPRAGELLPSLMGRAIALVLIACAALGFASLGLRLNGLNSAVLPQYEGEAVTVRGKVVTDPVRSGRANAFNLRVSRAGETEVRERLYLRMFGGRPPQLGDVVATLVKIRKLDRKNDFDLSLLRKGVVAKGSLSGERLEVIDDSPGVFLIVANRIRAEMQDLARKTLDRSSAGLVLGLTIGDDEAMPEWLKEDFQATSLSHLTAVSGTNVAVVLGAALLVLRASRASRRLQVIAGLVVILLFAAVTRWEPSVLRATVMAGLGLSAFLFGRLYEPRHGLALAFVGLLGYDPLMLWSVGFQLSFAATAGILVLTPRLIEHLQALPRIAAEAVAVALGAQLAVTPLLAFHFGRISLVSIPANLAAFPLVTPITVVGFLGAAAGFVSQQVGLALFEIAGAFARGLEWIAHFFASFPRATLALAPLRPAHVVAAYAAIAALTFVLAGRRRASRWALIGTLAVTASLFWSGAGASAPSEGLRVTFFDVGQGDAALVESPAGARMLVDGGPDAHAVASELAQMGIRRLDLVVFSHAHFDHVNGLNAVMSSIDVRSAVHPGVSSLWIDRMPPANRPEPTMEGDVFTIGDLTAEVLGPSAEQRETADSQSGNPEGEGSTLNDASVVMRVSLQDGCSLFTGDVEEQSQQLLTLNHRRGIECEVVKAPHHGSAKLDPGFVEAADPEVVPVSVGQNSFGHPSRTAVSLFERVGAEVLRTDRRGDIVLVIDAHGRVTEE
jgi:competence protein ComEC